MPGFELAKVCADVFEANPKVDGLVLSKHGLFSFGDTAKESYERHAELVTLAEEWLETKSVHGAQAYASVLRQPSLPCSPPRPRPHCAGCWLRPPATRTRRTSASSLNGVRRKKSELR